MIPAIQNSCAGFSTQYKRLLLLAKYPLDGSNTSGNSLMRATSVPKCIKSTSENIRSLDVFQIVAIQINKNDSGSLFCGNICVFKAYTRLESQQCGQQRHTSAHMGLTYKIFYRKAKNVSKLLQNVRIFGLCSRQKVTITGATSQEVEFSYKGEAERRQNVAHVEVLSTSLFFSLSLSLISMLSNVALHPFSLGKQSRRRGMRGSAGRTEKVGSGGEASEREEGGL